jgi:exonuclease III
MSAIISGHCHVLSVINAISIFQYVSVSSLNCHGFDMGTALYLHRVGQSANVILLQETWLSDATCYKLSEAFNDYDVYHSSSMEEKLQSGILNGRPFGGTAILIDKRLSKRTFQLSTNCSRLTAVRYGMPKGPDIIFCSIYMPYNDNSIDYFVEFESVIGVMQSLVDSCIGCKFMFGGDLNISKSGNSRLCELLYDFCDSNCMMWVDHGSSVLQ